MKIEAKKNKIKVTEKANSVELLYEEISRESEDEYIHDRVEAELYLKLPEKFEKFPAGSWLSIAYAYTHDSYDDADNLILEDGGVSVKLFDFIVSHLQLKINPQEFLQKIAGKLPEPESFLLLGDNADYWQGKGSHIPRQLLTEQKKSSGTSLGLEDLRTQIFSLIPKALKDGFYILNPYGKFKDIDRKVYPNAVAVLELLQQMDEQDKTGESHRLRARIYEMGEPDSFAYRRYASIAHEKALQGSACTLVWERDAAFAFLRAGKLSNAIKLFSKLIKEDVDNKVLYLYLRGYAYRDQAKWEKAIADLSRAIDLDAEDPRFYELREKAFLSNGQTKESKEDKAMAKKLKAKKPRYKLVYPDADLLSYMKKPNADYRKWMDMFSIRVDSK